MTLETLAFIRDYVFTLPALAKFALGMVMIVAIPGFVAAYTCQQRWVCCLAASSSVRLSSASSADRPIADFMAELGKLLLMFFAGLEIDLALFRRARNRSIAFGITTTVLPLVLGTAVGLVFGYAVIPAIVIGSLLASHTLLGLPVLDRLGLKGLEPVRLRWVPL